MVKSQQKTFVGRTTTSIRFTRHLPSIEEVFAELLELKRQGKQVNTKSKELLSNGTQVGPWLSKNRKHLSEEKLQLLQNTTKISTNNNATKEETQNTPKPKTAISQEKLEAKINGMTDEQVRQELLKRCLQDSRHYRNANPEDKKLLNEKFSNSLSKDGNGIVIVLDTEEFNSARAVKSVGIDSKNIVVPQNVQKTVEKMLKVSEFKKCVKSMSLQEYLRLCIKNKTLISGVYADMQGCLSTEKDILDLLSQCNLSKECVVAMTVCARDPQGADFVNSFVTDLTKSMYESFNNSKQIFRHVYGNQQKMATLIHRVNLEK